jgi:hypothetical protein
MRRSRLAIAAILLVAVAAAGVLFVAKVADDPPQRLTPPTVPPGTPQRADATAAPTVTPTPAHGFAGTVVDQVTGTPVAGATIRLSTGDEATSDQAGAFVVGPSPALEALRPGPDGLTRIDVTVTAPGYGILRIKNWSYSPGATPFLELSAADRTFESICIPRAAQQFHPECDALPDGPLSEPPPRYDCPVVLEACEAARQLAALLAVGAPELKPRIQVEAFVCVARSADSPGGPYPLCADAPAGEIRQGFMFDIGSEPIFLPPEEFFHDILLEVSDAQTIGFDWRVRTLSCPAEGCSSYTLVTFGKISRGRLLNDHTLSLTLRLDPAGGWSIIRTRNSFLETHGLELTEGGRLDPPGAWEWPPEYLELHRWEP